jgi:hypothetical protein
MRPPERAAGRGLTSGPWICQRDTHARHGRARGGWSPWEPWRRGERSSVPSSPSSSVPRASRDPCTRARAHRPRPAARRGSQGCERPSLRSGFGVPTRFARHPCTASTARSRAQPRAGPRPHTACGSWRLTARAEHGGTLEKPERTLAPSRPRTLARSHARARVRARRWLAPALRSGQRERHGGRASLRCWSKLRRSRRVLSRILSRDGSDRVSSSSLYSRVVSVAKRFWQ